MASWVVMCVALTVQVEARDRVYEVDHVVSALPSYGELLRVL